jgi:hypothetical protein
MRGPKNFSTEHLNKIKKHISKINSLRALPVEVLDLESGIKTEYDSVRAAARGLNSNNRTIRRYIDGNKPFQGRYMINFKHNK